MTLSARNLVWERAGDPAEPVSVGVVIPAFRAAASIGEVIRAIPPFVDRILVVDDGCPEGSGVAAAAAGDPRVRVLRHDRNQGVGGAVLTGLRSALDEGVGIVLKLDADGQMDAREIPALAAPILLGEADYTKGNRWHDDLRLRAMPLRRRLGNLGLSFLAKAATGYWNVFDPTNGFVAIHRSAAAMLDLSRIHRRYFFEISLLIQLNCLDAVVRDVPIPARYRGEISSLRLSRAFLTFPFHLLRGLIHRLWRKYFVYDLSLLSVYLVAGVLLLLFGALFGGYQWILSASRGVPATTGTVMIAVLPIILGFQLLLQAVSLEVQSLPREPISRRFFPRRAEWDAEITKGLE